MAAELLSENPRPEIWALGELPPPVNGMSLLTEKVVQRLADQAPVTVVNWSAGNARPPRLARVVRFLRTALCIAKLFLHGSVQNARLYITANSRGGLTMTGLLIKTGRRLGYKIYLHHHVYMYIDDFDARMAWCDKNMSASDVHLMHGPKMIEDFRSQYASKAQFEFLYPSIASLPLGQPRTHVPKEFRVGFLANLTLEKGLDLVLDTFRALHQLRPDVRLCLAGPCFTPEAKRLIDDALEEFGKSASYIGAVYDNRKLEFFNSIDCFLFPSRTEAWPIVLNESLAAGVPVIATNRGCVRTCVGDRAGLVVGDATHYVAEAVRQVEVWIDSPEAYLAASRAAIDQADQFQRAAAVQLEQLIARICSPSEFVQSSDTVARGKCLTPEPKGA